LPRVKTSSRFVEYLRGGGIIVPVLTVLVAFLIGGGVIAITGGNPLDTYSQIFNGTGLNWLFPWVSGNARVDAAANLQVTLRVAGPLILLGLAVAFAFRAGLFNIGGQGQYLVGSFVAVWAGSSFGGLPPVLHILLAIVLAAGAGAGWAAIAGVLKAKTGANEVISTIMLNWTAIWIGVYLFGLGGPLHSSNPAKATVPISNEVLAGAKLPVLWGNPDLENLNIGILIALGGLVVFWFLLNRSVTGYETRAVGLNPDAARYGGISVGTNYVKVMAVCGAFAGLAGSLDVLGWQLQIGTDGILTTSNICFLGIAVALLGRNSAIGVLFSALLFAGLINGTSVRHLDPTVFSPQLASNLTLIIQGLIVLFVSAPVLATYVLKVRRKPKQASRPEVPAVDIAPFEDQPAISTAPGVRPEVAAAVMTTTEQVSAVESPVAADQVTESSQPVSSHQAGMSKSTDR
jgi:simple sugar transport system permease protein